ncbi:DNA cytosine methyltransferase [Falsiroseomonas sp.]|uniref:DNA cytosine methyltransferase n=1 Tax=Falsiroseomonas sp. TaxID=2870721 RepID=UPI0027352941|nr:DNA cytosine methyltransferase [Falsiroseomonas sp.]MDP3417897.1 DNA cytosine methyltransferase [Falsiroseomonas sp.]
MRAIDLFAGAGGFTEGATQAGATVVWAANHWQAAVQTHAANHPATEHSCQDLHQADWRRVPAHDLLLASPCCQGHTRARGKNTPSHDASRSTAWAVVSAAEYHRPAVIVVENVPEFRSWLLFAAWREAMAAMGYTLSAHVLDAADHGVPQHRERLILIGTRSRAPFRLPLRMQQHRPIAAVLDLGAGAWSPVATTRRAPATLARIARGRARFGDRFLIPYYGSGSGLTGRSLTRPIGTITTLARWAIVDGDRMRMLSVDETKAAMGFPAGYRLPAQIRPAIQMLGNAVPPPMARDVITAIREAT